MLTQTSVAACGVDLGLCALYATRSVFFCCGPLPMPRRVRHRFCLPFSCMLPFLHFGKKNCRAGRASAHLPRCYCVPAPCLALLPHANAILLPFPYFTAPPPHTYPGQLYTALPVTHPSAADLRPPRTRIHWVTACSATPAVYLYVSTDITCRT